MEITIKVKKKGIIIIPKKIRESVNIREGDTLIVKTEKGKIILEKMEPLKVKIPVEEVEEILREENELEERKIESILKNR